MNRQRAFDRHPRPEEVKAAVAAACRQVSCTAAPEAVMRGVSLAAGDYTASRARAFAAMALYQLFDIKRVTASQLVGVRRKSMHCHIGSIESALRAGSAKWFTEARLWAVKIAIADCVGFPVSKLPGPIDLGPIRRRKPVAVAASPVAASPGATSPVAPTLLVFTQRRAAEPCNVFGDPPLERSALAGAAPWTPYEQSAACREAWAREDAKRQ